MSILDTLRQFLFLYLLFDRAIVWGGEPNSCGAIYCVLFMFGRGVAVGLVAGLGPWARVTGCWCSDVGVGGMGSVSIFKESIASTCKIVFLGE